MSTQNIKVSAIFCVLEEKFSAVSTDRLLHCIQVDSVGRCFPKCEVWIQRETVSSLLSPGKNYSTDHKKVLLGERKRHTDRGVSSTPSVTRSGVPPPARLRPGGTQGGVPPWPGPMGVPEGGYPPPQSGYPPPGPMGGTPIRVPLPGLTGGYPRWGTTPIRVFPPGWLDLARVPPPPLAGVD